MSKIKPGQIGYFSGKIGEVVVAKFRNLTIGRSTPRKSSKQPTTKQVTIRTTFSLITALIAALRSFINIGYPRVSGNLSGSNVAFKYHSANAVIDGVNGPELDYEKVVLSRGIFPDVYDVTVVSNVGHNLKVTWKMDVVPGDGSDPKDTVALAAYCPELGIANAYYQFAQRSTLTGTMPMRRVYIGKKVHVYMFMVSLDGKQTSASNYLGDYQIVE